MLANRNNARKFYQKVRRLTEGFKTGAFSCKNKDGELSTDIQINLKLWREHFSNLLNSDSCACHREVKIPIPQSLTTELSFRYPIMTRLRIAITRLKNNKPRAADGLPAELFKLDWTLSVVASDLGKSTIDHIFSTRQILEKTHERRIDTTIFSSTSKRIRQYGKELPVCRDV